VAVAEKVYLFIYLFIHLFINDKIVQEYTEKYKEKWKQNKWTKWSSWWRCCLGHSKNFSDDDDNDERIGLRHTQRSIIRSMSAAPKIESSAW